MSRYNRINEDTPEGSNVEGFSENGEMLNYMESLEQLSGDEREIALKLQKQLQFFLMDPIKKYKVRHQFPWKLMLQVLKIILITIQLILFAELRVTHVDFLEDTATVMRHKFLKDWDDERDVVAYPPPVGKYSVYRSTDLIEHFAFIVNSYYSLHNDSFASFSYDTGFTPYNKTKLSSGLRSDTMNYTLIPCMQLCTEKLRSVRIHNKTYEFDISPMENCNKLQFTIDELIQINEDPSALQDILASRNITFKADDSLGISKLTLHFNLRTIHFSPVLMDENPECYLIKIAIVFDNSRHTGQIQISLHSLISYVNICNGRALNDRKLSLHTLPILVIDILVFTCCLLSLGLCIRSMIKAYILQLRTGAFFKKNLYSKLSVIDKLEFVNLWNVMILLNDVFIIIGTLCKVSIEFRDFENHLFTLSSVFLGIGALLVYVGVLRYFIFFDEYNVIVLTLKKSIPNIMRFMVCTIILYLGFLFSGWMIIGAYSFKFRTLAKSSETLFSLINGDDMFPTFATINDTNTTIKVVGTIYIYAFVSLFIYVILSLFIAIIMDAYDVIKSRYTQKCHPKVSQLQEFLACAAEPDLNNSSSRIQFARDSQLPMTFSHR
uniref:PKD_channel domain-containing protein n=1 Tax=Rhabditophanes sp. KR3021 TaxID=114890 RepID=A0AC35U8E0_9BILA